MKKSKFTLDNIYDVKPKDGRIISAEYVKGEYFYEGKTATDVPGMLIVDIECSYGRNSCVRHRMWLPDDWNGIFLGVGNGGFAGKLSVVMWKEAALGYAVAQTDMGTSRLRDGDESLAPEDMWLDYGHRSTHRMAEMAKEMIFAAYGSYPEYSYFRGASAGGCQAFSEFQRYPEDFDGVIGTVPSNNSLGLRMYFLWCFLKLRDGKEPLFKDEECEDVYSLVLEFFSAHGQTENGYITYGWVGEDTVDQVISFIKEKCPSLGGKKINALREMYEGPINRETGKRIFCGMPFGAEINSGYFGEENNDERYGAPWYRVFFGEDYREESFNFASDAELLHNALSYCTGANESDLHAFKARGGKIICYSGGADPLGPWPDAMNYYNRVCQDMGGYDNVKDFFKYYVIPGRAHGSYGRGLNLVGEDTSDNDLLNAIRAWRERGIEPGAITCHHVKEWAIDHTDGEVEILFSQDVYPYEGNLKAGVDFPPSSDECYLKRRPR